MKGLQTVIPAQAGTAMTSPDVIRESPILLPNGVEERFCSLLY
jgi:hypothetical protein